MKPSRHLKRLLKNESAQALVETVIVLPVVIFFILGTIQLTLMHQARLMLEYAAFNAARAGSVWNADKNRMQRAALMSLIPTAPKWPVDVGFLSVGTIEDYGDLIEAAAKIVANDKTQGLLFSIVTVDVLSPTEEDVPEGQSEIDFDVASDSFSTRKLSQLTIRVSYMYNLVIPFANMILWNSWYVTRATWAMGFGSRVASFLERYGLIDQTGGHARSPFIAFDYPGRTSDQATVIEGMIMGIESLLGMGGFSNPYECLSFYNWAQVVLATRTGDSLYYLPLITTHTIRMQSNHYKKNLPTKEDASCGGHA